MEGDRFGPTHGAGAAAAAYRDDDADVLRDAASLEDETGQGSEGQEGTVLGLGGVDYEYKDWMDPDWQVPDTVEEVNRLWEEHRMVGWWREGSTRAREEVRAEGEGVGGGGWVRGDDGRWVRVRLAGESEPGDREGSSSGGGAKGDSGSGGRVGGGEDEGDNKIGRAHV